MAKFAKRADEMCWRGWGRQASSAIGLGTTCHRSKASLNEPVVSTTQVPHGSFYMVCERKQDLFRSLGAGRVLSPPVVSRHVPLGLRARGQMCRLRLHFVPLRRGTTQHSTCRKHAGVLRHGFPKQARQVARARTKRSRQSPFPRARGQARCCRSRPRQGSQWRRALGGLVSSYPQVPWVVGQGRQRVFAPSRARHADSQDATVNHDPQLS